MGEPLMHVTEVIELLNRAACLEKTTPGEFAAASVQLQIAQETVQSLRAKIEMAKAALTELSQLGGGRSEGNYIAQRALAKLDVSRTRRYETNDCDIREGVAMSKQSDEFLAKAWVTFAAAALQTSYVQDQAKGQTMSMPDALALYAGEVATAMTLALEKRLVKT
jgi:hypothetical protein